MQDLISQCMDKLPSARPNAFQVLQRLQLLAKDPATFGTERPEPNERYKSCVKQARPAVRQTLYTPLNAACWDCVFAARC